MVNTITTPVTITIKNVSDKVQRFVPYKENFATSVGAGTSIQLVAETVGQVLYYQKQAIAGALEIGPDVAIAASNVVIASPAKIVIENTSDRVKMFVPYRENFSQEVAVGDSYTFEVKTAGQALYYASQETDGLNVDIEEA